MDTGVNCISACAICVQFCEDGTELISQDCAQTFDTGNVVSSVLDSVAERASLFSLSESSLTTWFAVGVVVNAELDVTADDWMPSMTIVVMQMLLFSSISTSPHAPVPSSLCGGKTDEYSQPPSSSDDASADFNKWC